ncbi:hypothetical protein [Gordonia sp. i37]|uniref:hypothetical protein n=1 Tax=Gordonia sp. i37 TaxID=1961707 RepID=UPI0009AE5714|nr:hypothetical protein [Gordonia sp. i37]OPX17055.1 hypothetical protein B1964_01585 [Gordonia sp. i37]
MSDPAGEVVPVWTLTTRDTTIPAVVDDVSMTPERLDGLRSALAAFADAPIATLEAHSLHGPVDRSSGLALSAASPLAQQLSLLVTRTPKVVADGGETMYRMVVPAKAAAQMATGALTPMAAKGAGNGAIYGALVNESGKIAAQAKFVPVSAGKAGVAGAAAGAAAVTVAAPLVLMAVAVAASAHADQKRQQAIEHITELLQRLHADKLADEQHELQGCKSAITKATSIVLDKGKLGVSLGLDSAVNVIDTAMARAESRITKWEKALANIGDGSIELGKLTREIATLDDPAGEFYVHVQLARTSIELKRRTLILQAVEHAQHDEGNPFERFVQTLQVEERETDALATRLSAVLLRLSSMQLDRSRGKRDILYTPGDVDKLLHTSRRLQELGALVEQPDSRANVTIDIVQEKDGSVLVLPPVAS